MYPIEKVSFGAEFGKKSISFIAQALENCFRRDQQIEVVNETTLKFPKGTSIPRQCEKTWKNIEVPTNTEILMICENKIYTSGFHNFLEKDVVKVVANNVEIFTGDCRTAAKIAHSTLVNSISTVPFQINSQIPLGKIKDLQVDQEVKKVAEWLIHRFGSETECIFEEGFLGRYSFTLKDQGGIKGTGKFVKWDSNNFNVAYASPPTYEFVYLWPYGKPFEEAFSSFFRKGELSLNVTVGFLETTYFFYKINGRGSFDCFPSRLCSLSTTRPYDRVLLALFSLL